MLSVYNYPLLFIMYYTNLVDPVNQCSEYNKQLFLCVGIHKLGGSSPISELINLLTVNSTSFSNYVLYNTIINIMEMR